MGFVLSRFRKKKTTTDQLEEIEQKIKSIEKFQKETEQQFRRVIAKLIVSSISVYLIALVIYYYYYSPETFKENIIKFMPLLVFPVAIIFSRKLLSWYYRRKLSKNESNLKTLKANKKKILEEVMDKEVYKVAKEILEKYAPDQLTKDARKIIPGNTMKAIMPVTPMKGDSMARQRLISSTPAERKFGSSRPSGVAFQAVPNMAAQAQPRLSLTRPILQRDRGAFDKLVDMIIGDGPSNRYALICRVCCSHNGMALKNEFEYLAFRCAYCLQWNPARKQKPHAPNLISDGGSQDESDANNSEPEPSADLNDPVASENNPESPAVSNDSVASENSNEISNTRNNFNESQDSCGTNDSEAVMKEKSIDVDVTEAKPVDEIIGSETVYLHEIDVPVSSDTLDLTALHNALDELDTSSSSSKSSPVTDPASSQAVPNTESSR